MTPDADQLSALEADAIREVHERHDAFVAWFTHGNDEAVMDTIIASFGPNFALVGPDGVTLKRDVLIEGLRPQKRSCHIRNR